MSKTGEPRTPFPRQIQPTNTTDRGCASVALRSLAIAGECLTVRREQEEVLEIFKRIHRDTGWRIGFIPHTLRAKWGWSSADPSPKLPTQADPYLHLKDNPPRVMPSGVGFEEQEFDQYAVERAAQQQQQRAQAAQAALQQGQAALQQGQAQAQAQQGSPGQGAMAPPREPPQGIVNPLFASADFGLPKHAYQDHYVVPVHDPAQYQQGPGGLEYSSTMFWLLQPGYRQMHQ